jgi:hypothetical protein
MVKASDGCLDFVFISGVTKFSAMSVFSTLNNLADISTEPEFAAFMGLTQTELEHDFAPHITAAAEQLRSDEKRKRAFRADPKLL